MPLAIQEHLLPGNTHRAKFQAARVAGFTGVEVQIDSTFFQRLPELVEAARETGLQVTAVHIGQTRLIHPDFNERDRALVAMREAMSAAVDLGAQGVIFRPYYAPGPVLPDLHPYKSALELEAELLVTQLRATLCDLAYALGTELLLQPVNHTETHLVRRLSHAALIRKRLDHHPHLKIAASLDHMAREGEPFTVLADHRDDLGYLQISDTGGTLPGSGATDFPALLTLLRDSGYSGWLTVAGEHPTARQPDELAACVACLAAASG